MLYQHMTYHRIGEKNLFILPSLPSSVVLDDLEAIAFYRFSQEQNLAQAQAFLCERTGIPIAHAQTVLAALLDKLKRARIYPLSMTQWRYDEDEIYPVDIHLCLTRGCNLRCKHCYISADLPQSGELDLDAWKTGFSALFQYMPQPNITISGGEPTQKPYLNDLIQFLDKYAKVTLFTNGRRNVDHLLPYLCEVQVSLDGISSKTNDQIRGLGSFVKISQFIKNFADKSKLTVALTLMAHNFDEVKANLHDFIGEHGLRPSHLRLNAQLEDFGRAENLSADYKNFYFDRTIEIAEFIRSIKPEIDSEKTRDAAINRLNCGIGLSIGIDSNGDIYPCDEFVNKTGHLLSEDLSEVLQKTVEINRATQINKMPYCQKCDLKYICLGGCKAKNLQKTGSYFIPDCSEQKKWTQYVALAYQI